MNFTSHLNIYNFAYVVVSIEVVCELVLGELLRTLLSSSFNNQFLKSGLKASGLEKLNIVDSTAICFYDVKQFSYRKIRFIK